MVTLEEAHLIVKRCSDEIRSRGLHEVDIFKPIRIGDSVDEVRDLISCLLCDSRTEYEDKIGSQNIHVVVSAMKWALRHCNTILVPYEYYDEFVRYEQEWDYDPSKGSFNKFLNYLPKQNQVILCDIFDICAQVTAESHINKMSAERLVKTIALCILGDQDKSLLSFGSAYDEWAKCSAACHHLFLAYLREKSVSTELNPRLTVLLDNYVEYRKKSVTSAYFQMPLPENTTIAELDGTPKQINRPRKRSIVTFAETTEITEKVKTTMTSSNARPISILRVTRQVPTTKSETKRQTRNFTTLLPDIMDGMKRKTIVRPSTMMTVKEKQTAEEMWSEFQKNGITAMSDEFLKLFFSLDDRSAGDTNSNISEKQWSQFSRKGFKSVYVEPLPKDNVSERGSSETMKEQSSNQEISLSRNDSGVSGVTLRQTVVWDDFSKKGFRNSDGNMSTTLTINSITQSEKENLEKEKTIGKVIIPSAESNSRKNSKSRKKMVKFRSLKPRRARSFESTPREIEFDNAEEDWEDWDIIDRALDLPVTTHLAIETIDEIFPYVWMETTAAEQGDKWGEWVFIEPRKGLINECEWVMIEEKSQVFSEWETTKTYTRRRKMSAFSTFSTFSIPWVRGCSKSRPVSKMTSRMSKFSCASSVMPALPAVWAMFDRSRPDDNLVTTNYKFKNKPTNPKAFAYQAAQLRESIMQTGFDDGAKTMSMLQYESEEQYVEGQYYDQYDEYEDDYDYENDPTGENGYNTDPGYYGQYNEYQEEYWEGEEDNYYNDQEYNDQEYDDQEYNDQEEYNDQDYNDQEYNEKGDYNYDQEGYYTEEVEEQYSAPTPGSFVAQRQMMLQGEIPAIPKKKSNFYGLSYENNYKNSKLFPMQAAEPLGVRLAA
ncbi:169_t:CDS:2 [Funneliformis mosseae]|uniref:169_t:CDS:1 n=1 Tax=Funneliformis mosseae TaxID=27381 RepID=A0A9N8WKN8_FUNMO|nr:169_t:CDS:2 [Funneliformis mosseae]